MIPFRSLLLAVASLGAASLAGAQLPTKQPIFPKSPPSTPAKPATTPAKPAAGGKPGAAATPSPYASLIGGVVDSIYGGALAGATIVVDGTSRSTQADSTGFFRVDSIPMGSWRLALYHPLLDSIGVSIATQAIPFKPGDTLTVQLSSPSIGSLAAQWCAPAAARLGPGAVIGRVVDAETGEAVSGARTSLVWQESQVIAGFTTKPATRVRTAVTDATGRYSLCGLPFEMTGTLMVERPGSKTPEIPVTLDQNGFGLHTVLLAPAVVAAATTPGDSTPQRRRGTSTLRGRVLGPDRRPLGGVRVSVEGTGAEATTDAEGTFSIGQLPAGTWTVLARRVGLAPEQRVVGVAARSSADVAFTMRTATELARVVVRDTVATGLSRVGFEQRAKSGFGRYLTPDQIEQMHPQHASDVLRTMPGITVRSDAGTGRTYITSTRDAGGGCVELFLDGMSTMDGGQDMDSMISADQLAAVEVYPSSNVPAEFQRAGRGSCAAIVMWTKTHTGRKAR